MKRFAVLFLALVLPVMGFSVVALAETDVNASDFIGTWYVDDTATGYDRIDINEGGTITVYALDVAIDPVEGSWSADESGLAADLGESGSVEMTLEADVLSLNDGTETVTFTKQAPLAPVAEEFIGTWYGRNPEESAYAITFNDDFTLKIYATADMSEDTAVSGTWSLGTRYAIIEMEGGTLGICYEMDGCLTVCNTDGSEPYDFESGLDISK